MITLADLERKARSQYDRVLQSYLTSENPFPLVIRASKNLDRRSGVDAIFEQQHDLILHSKNKTGRGYTLELKFNYKTGQSEIRKISFETPDDLLYFIRKEEEYQRYVEDVERIRRVVPALLGLFERMPRLVIEQAGRWPDLLKVVAYFRQTPKPQQYVRSLPIAVPTKFIENNRTVLRVLLDHLIPDHLNPNETDFYKRFHLNVEEPLVKIRFLDESLRLHPALTHATVWLSEFRELRLAGRRVYIIENLTSFLTFPNIPDSIAIWGSGFAVTLLRGIDWLQAKQLYYWGDIDIHGFQILSEIRTYYPNIQSLLMDCFTFQHFHQGERGGAFNPLTLNNLTDEEGQIYKLLLAENWRVEQERLGMDWVSGQLGLV